jgi:uncharacterized protein (TIGR00369 family)
MMVPTLEGLQHELERCPFHDLLQLEAVRADAELTVVRLPFRSELGLSHGGEIFHGGVLASLIDITAHAALALRVGCVVPTVDLRIDFLTVAAAPGVVAEARILRAGRSLGRTDVEVKDGHGVLVACGRGTFSTSRSPNDTRPGGPT